jgi:predicted phosphoribosyltransferase
MRQFKDRRQAGQLLAKQLANYANNPDILILALPRGGVPVAFEIAKKLNLPLDVYIVRKLGAPEHEELAVGAIASDNTVVFNHDILHSLSLDASQLHAVIEKERHELERRNKLYRKQAPFPDIMGKTIIMVDDGIATGATLRAAVAAIKKSNPAKIIIAVPVGAPDTCEALKEEVDQLVCILSPQPLYSVGAWYETFPQTTDEEVIHLLQLIYNS